jgi:hypothetical protein
MVARPENCDCRHVSPSQSKMIYVAEHPDERHASSSLHGMTLGRQKVCFELNGFVLGNAERRSPSSTDHQSGLFVQRRQTRTYDGNCCRR